MSDPATQKAQWWRTIAFLVALATVATVALASVGLAASQRLSAAAFQDDMRKLWEDHVTWTRLVIVSVVADLPGTGPTVERLLRNQVDIGDAIKPFYGDAAGNQLTSLLTDHILIAADVLVAAKAGDSAATEEALGRWYSNGDEIASFLSSANPENWPLDMTQSMMREHLDLTLAEAVAELQGDYAGGVEAYDVVHEQALEMADMLSSGIIAQFPGQFTMRGLFM